MSARGQLRRSPLGHRLLHGVTRAPAAARQPFAPLAGLRVPILVRCLPSAPGLQLPSCQAREPGHPAPTAM